MRFENSIKSAIKEVLGRALVHEARNVLRTEFKRGLDINKYVNLAYTFHKRLNFVPRVGSLLSIAPAQVREEITDLLKILAKCRPRRVLEIGTAAGGTLFLFCRVATPDAIVASIDLSGGPFGGGYPSWRIPLYKSFAWGEQEIVLIRANSQNPRTLKVIKKALNNEELDFLFIDGDHTYQGVRRDFEMYSPLVRSGGIVAFHDIVEHPTETECAVSRFWNLNKHSYDEHLEIVEDQNQKWAGIGVLYV